MYAILLRMRYVTFPVLVTGLTKHGDPCSTLGHSHRRDNGLSESAGGNSDFERRGQLQLHSQSRYHSSPGQRKKERRRRTAFTQV